VEYLGALREGNKKVRHGRAGPGHAVQSRRLLAVLLAHADGGLRGGEAGDRHAVGRAADVVQADALAELDRRRVAAVFAADAQLYIGPGRPAPFGGDADQVADAFLVQADEGVLLEDALLDIGV